MEGTDEAILPVQGLERGKLIALRGSVYFEVSCADLAKLVFGTLG